MDEELLNQDTVIPEETAETTPETAAEGDVPVMEDQPGEDTGLISKYFPSTEVTESNKSELSTAAAAMEELATIKPRFEKLLANNKELKAFFESNPDAAAAMSDALNGEDFWMAAAKYVDFGSIAPQEGEPDYEKWSQNKESRMKNLSDKEAWNKEMEENEQFSAQELKKFQDAHGLDEAQMDEFIAFCEPIANEIMRKKFSLKFFEQCWKDKNYDSEMENAKEEGRTEAANTRIEDFMEKDEQQMQGDGMPNLSSSSTSVAPVAAKMPIFRPKKEFRV